MDGYNKRHFAFFFFAFTLFCTYAPLSAITLPIPVINKRKNQLTAAMAVFKQRIKNTILPATVAHAPMPQHKMTQTESYMHRFKQEINAQWGSHVNTHDAMIKKIIEREREYVTSHYVFYHAHQSNMRLIHDIIKELYRFFFQYAALPHFKFIRFWKDASPHLGAQAFLSHYKKHAFSGYFDSSSEIAQQVLCVNLSLFGNRGYCGESSFHYFLYNSSCLSTWFYTFLDNLFTRLDINTKRTTQLMNLTTKLKAPDGSGQILQIFIPKIQVDTYAYVSHAYGTPHGPIAAAPANMAFDKTLKRHTSIKPILESYQNNPFEMDKHTYDFLQARIILNAQIFDPKSDVKIYRYCSIPKAQLSAYKKELREIVAQALEEWSATYAAKPTLPLDLQGTAIDVLLKKII